MRALVTGGHGFIGRHLVRRLRERGGVVRVLHRRPGIPPNLAAWDVEVATGDLRDASGLEAAVHDVDVVFHLAGLTRARTAAEMFDVNAGGTARLLAAMRRVRPTATFVYCSSTAARGPSPRPEPTPLDESPPPISTYGRSKARAEELIARHAGEVRWVVLRPTAVYGPGDRDFLALFQGIARGVALVPGRPGAMVSLIHADDVVGALLALADTPSAARATYAAAHPDIVSMEQVIAAAERAVGRHARRVAVPASVLRLVGRIADMATQATGRPSLYGSARVVEIAARHWVCSPEPLARATGWRARLDLVSGFEDTVAAYRAEGRLGPAASERPS